MNPGRFNFGSKVSDTASGYLDRIKPKEENASQITETEEFNETFTLFKTISVHSPGESFGELALVANKSRAQTALCTEDTVLVSLSREVYSRVIEKAVKRDLLNRIAFLKSFTIFQSMSMTALERLLLFTKMMVVQRGKVFYKVGDKPDSWDLITSGLPA